MFTCHYAIAGQHHDSGETDAEDSALTKVKHGQSRGGLQRRGLVHLQESIVALRLVPLVVEILKTAKHNTEIFNTKT